MKNASQNIVVNLALSMVTAILLLLGCKKTIQSHAPITFPSVNVKDYGATGNGTTDDTQAFNLAMDAADSLQLPVYVPNGFYRAAIRIRHDKQVIVGQQQPGANLTEGTVIIGKINCANKKYITISNIGIDSRGQLQAPADWAALISGDGLDSIPLHQNFNHISLIGDGFFQYMHGILCQSGSNIVIKNITVSYFFHGIAARASNVSVDSVNAISCGFTSVIVKSADGANLHTHDVSVNHINTTGSATDPYNRAGVVLVQSYVDGSKTENVTVQNVNSTNGGVACVQVEQVAGTIQNVTVQNCTSVGQGDINTRACYDITGGTNITFQNCSAKNSLGYGFRSTGDVHNVRVINSSESNSGAGAWTGNFSYLQLNGIEIIR